MIEAGSLVVISLVNPREKYWGRLDSIGAAGVFVRGLDLQLAEEWARELARGGEVGLGVASVFFPLSRVERIYLDEQVGSVPSVAERFLSIVGRAVEECL